MLRDHAAATTSRPGRAPCRPPIIPTAVTDLDHARPLGVGEGSGLLERLAILPDPPGGDDATPWPACWPSAPRRCWPAPQGGCDRRVGGDAPGPVLAGLGMRHDPLTRRWQAPGEATIRRVLAGVDADRLDRRSAPGWLSGCTPGPRRRGRSPLTARRWVARSAAAMPGRCGCWPSWTTPTPQRWPNARSTPPATRSHTAAVEGSTLLDSSGEIAWSGRGLERPTRRFCDSLWSLPGIQVPAADR